jgi:thiol-disulfide isomerase/thioredoxin
MTIHHAPETSDVDKRSLLAIAIIATFAIAAFVLTRPVTPVQGLSSVAGLISLKASAQAATPYAIAATNGRPTLLEFYADWCTTCQALAPTLQSVHGQFGEDLNIVMLDIDDPHWQQQLQDYRVTGVPHLVLLEDDGAIADTFVGKVPKSVLVDRIQQIL